VVSHIDLADRVYERDTDRELNSLSDHQQTAAQDQDCQDHCRAGRVTTSRVANFTIRFSPPGTGICLAEEQ
jgi:hypothetical protein